MMEPCSIRVEVDVPKSKGNENHSVILNGERLHLYDLFIHMNKSKWGKDYFQDMEDGLFKVKPGYLMVLEGKMVQAWQVQETPLKDGQHFKLVRVVAGG
jgi:sulfur carrier protein ThiS